MIEARFKSVENDFSELKKQFLKGELSREQFAQALRELRLLDDQGRCWMIGAQTGRWYYYDGKNWIQGVPPESQAPYVICPGCGAYNESQAQLCVKCGQSLSSTRLETTCLNCGYTFQAGETICPVCGFSLDQEAARLKTQTSQLEMAPFSEPGATWVLKTVDYKSFLLFSGGLGIFMWMLIGLLAGATEFFTSVIPMLPGFFQEIQGKMLGGLIYSLFGGVFGFLLFALLGLLAALLINASIYFLGGPVFHLNRPEQIRAKKD